MRTTLGQCVNCGKDIVQDARTWSLRKTAGKDSLAGSLAFTGLLAEDPNAAIKQSRGERVSEDYSCPQCGVTYPNDIWGELALGLSMLSGLSMMPGGAGSQEADKYRRECETLTGKLKVCSRCKTIYKSGFLKGCARCK